MKTTNNFVMLGQLDPEAARNLLPGVNFHASRRTFAQIASEKFEMLRIRNAAVAASPEPSINIEQAKVVRDAAMTAHVHVKDD